jgi:RNase H-fold protein (predicted Holliday junction resolvase)
VNILSIDPGRDKCGVAVVSESGVLHRNVSETPNLEQDIREISGSFHLDRFVIGDGTNSKTIAERISPIVRLEPIFVDEYMTTMLARKRYFEENPPKGLARLVPVSMQVPKVPYDDYVAVILAEKYLSRQV